MGLLPPIIADQGQLNRILPHVVVTDFPQLNVTAPYMGKSLVALTFGDGFDDQIPTATGLVNSPPPFTSAQVVVSLLRTQALANIWLTQVQVRAVVGSVTVWSDSTNFQPVTINECAIMQMDPGVFDGTDPVVKVTLKGIYYINNDLWA